MRQIPLDYSAPYQGRYPVAAMCWVLGVSESGYHALRKRPPSPRAQENARLEVEIRAAHDRTRQTYGPERLQADLADNGIRVGFTLPASRTCSVVNWWAMPWMPA